MGLTRIRAAQISDIDYKQAVRVITLTNVTLTGGAPAEVDGVSLVVGDRILVNGQTNAAQNGLYQVQTVGAGSNGTWVRTSDGNQDGEIQPGMVVMVTQGTEYADTPWKLITNGTIIIGVTELVFEENYSLAFGNIYANGTAIVANTVSAAVTITAGNNISITGNNTSKTLDIAVTGISLSSIANGTSNVDIAVADGNVTTTVNGNTTLTITDTGANITGYVTATGNIDGANLTTAGTVDATGNVSGGNIVTAGAVDATGNVSGGNIVTAGNVDGANVNATGTVTATGNVSGGNITTAGAVDATGNVSGGNIVTAGAVDATGNVSGGNITTAGNVDGANVNATANVTATGAVFSGNVTADTFIGNIQGNIDAGGANTDIQFNDDDVLAGSAAFTFDKTSNAVVATGNITGGNLITAGNVDGANVNTTAGITAGTTIVATGNVSGGNITTAGNVDGANLNTTAGITAGTTIIATGNVSGGNLTTVGNVDSANVNATAGITAGTTIVATGNITGGNVDGGNISATNQLSGATLQTTGDASIGGNLTVQGNLIYVNVEDLRVEDPVIIMGTGPNGDPLTSDDNQDRGIYMEYYVAGLGNAFVGWQNASGNLIAASNVEFAGNNIVSVVEYGTLQAGNLYVESIVSQGNVTADYFLGNVACASGIFTTKIFNGTSEANIGTSGGNLVVSIDGTADVMQVTPLGVDIIGDLLVGNIAANSAGLTGELTVTGNVTGDNILGNGAGLSGINVFSTIEVTGQSDVVANSISDTLTLVSGIGIDITTDASNNAVTITGTGSSGQSIFNTGGTLGLVTEPVQVAEDLGLVTELVDEEYDLESLLITNQLLYPTQLVLPSYTVAELGNVSTSPAGQFVFCTDETGGAIPAYSDGSNWRRVSDRAIVT